MLCLSGRDYLLFMKSDSVDQHGIRTKERKRIEIEKRKKKGKKDGNWFLAFIVKSKFGCYDYFFLGGDSKKIRG